MTLDGADYLVPDTPGLGVEVNEELLAKQSSSSGKPRICAARTARTPTGERGPAGRGGRLTERGRGWNLSRSEFQSQGFQSEPS